MTAPPHPTPATRRAGSAQTWAELPNPNKGKKIALAQASAVWLHRAADRRQPQGGIVNSGRLDRFCLPTAIRYFTERERLRHAPKAILCSSDTGNPNGIAAMNAVFQSDLGPGLKLTALGLADAANTKDQCWPSIRTLAKKCSQSERSVQRHLRELERQDGYLSRGNGRHRTPLSNTLHLSEV